MKNRKTHWEDSGYDCNHCGGEIYKRTEKAGGKPVANWYECQKCGRQWSMEGKTIHEGFSRQANQSVTETKEPTVTSFDLGTWRKPLYIVAGISVVVLLVRFGGLGALRMAILLGMVGVVIYYAYFYGRQKSWW